jgi:hypothetical protein
MPEMWTFRNKGMKFYDPELSKKITETAQEILVRLIERFDRHLTGACKNEITISRYSSRKL